MKTLVLRNYDNSIYSKVKVDIFASNADLQSAGFDTRFTNMQFERSGDAAIVAGLSNLETEENWRSIIAAVEAIEGIGLYLVDQNEAIDTTTAAQQDDVTLEGNDGSLDIVVDGVLYQEAFDTDLATTSAAFDVTHDTPLGLVGVTLSDAAGVLSFAAVDPAIPMKVGVKDLSSSVNAALQANVTLTGGAGSANVIVDKVEYLATFNTSLTQTGVDFVTLHGAALLARGYTVTSNTGVLQFACSNPNQETEVSIVSVATLDGTISTDVTLTEAVLRLVIDGVNYDETFDTDFTTTATAFYTSHAANLNSAGITCTNPSAGVLRFVSLTAGVEFGLIVNIFNNNFGGAIVNTTLNQSGIGEITIVSPSHDV
jgi:hypothetical protein